MDRFAKPRSRLCQAGLDLRVRAHPEASFILTFTLAGHRPPLIVTVQAHKRTCWAAHRRYHLALSFRFQIKQESSNNQSGFPVSRHAHATSRGRGDGGPRGHPGLCPHAMASRRGGSKTVGALRCEQDRWIDHPRHGCDVSGQRAAAPGSVGIVVCAEEREERMSAALSMGRHGRGRVLLPQHPIPLPADCARQMHCLLSARCRCWGMNVRRPSISENNRTTRSRRFACCLTGGRRLPWR